MFKSEENTKVSAVEVELKANKKGRNKAIKIREMTLQMDEQIQIKKEKKL